MENTQKDPFEEAKATFDLLVDESEGEDSDMSENDFNDSDYYDDKGIYKIAPEETKKKKKEETKKKIRPKNKHNRLPTVEDEENSKFSMKFMKTTDYSNAQRKEYYQSLEVNMDALVKQLRDIEYHTGGINITMIAEKPSAAKEIAMSLSKAKCDPKYFENLERYEFAGEFRGISAFYTVTSVMGFLYRTHYTKQELDYDIDPHDFLDDEVCDYRADFKEGRRRNRFPTLMVMDNLEYVLDGSHLIIFWTDNDLAGERICFEVLKFIQRRKIRCLYKNVLRAHFSSLSHIEINESFEDLSCKPDKAKSLACHARDVIDLRVGLSFTTFLTFKVREQIGEKLAKRISYGPCQFPAFYFCYQRYLEVKNFKPYKYYAIKATLKNKDGEEVEIFLDQEFEEEKEAKALVDKISKKEAIFEKTEEETITIPKPLPINILKTAAEELGYSATKTSRIAQTLYRKGMISYPRTNSREYNSNLEYIPMLESHSEGGNYKEIAKDLLKRIQNQESTGEIGKYAIVKLKDGEYQAHPPVMPVSLPSKQRIFVDGSDSKHLHDLITRHFLSTLDCPATLKNSTSTVKIGDLSFKSLSSTLTEKAFIKYYTPSSLKPLLKHLNSPLLTKGTYKISSFTLQKLQKSPPQFLSEPELISLLETNKIGTDGTIPDHIQKIVKREYVKAHCEPRQFIPTSLGVCLAEGFKEIQPELIQPSVRKYIQNGCRKIENYELKYDSVMEKEFIKVFRAKLVVFMNSFKKIKENLKKMQEIGHSIAAVKERIIRGKDEEPLRIEKYTGDLIEKEETIDLKIVLKQKI